MRKEAEMKGIAWGVVVLLLCPAGPAVALTLYVSPQGRDSWTGRLPVPNRQHTDGPLASLQGARDAIRRAKAANGKEEPIIVRFAPGVYPLREPFVLEPQDSGTAEAPIIYQGTPGQTIIFGGRRITGFQRGADGIWRTKIINGQRDFEDLWIGGKRLLRARTPNAVWAGDTPQPRYFYVRKKMLYGNDPATGQYVEMSRRGFYAYPEDIQGLRSVPPGRLSDVTLVSYHAWETTRHRLQAVDFETGAVITTGNAPWAFQWLGPNHRYHLENYPAALDAPGEWLLSADGTLSVVPLPGMDMRRAEAIVPVLPEFMRLRGEPTAGLYVEHVIFRDLAFEYSAYQLPPEGHGDGQAAVTIPAAIILDGSRHIVFERVQLRHIGGTYGLWLRRGCWDCLVRQCEFADLGAGGIKIGEPFIQTQPELQTHRCVVDNCLIRSGGRKYAGAVGLWIGQSSDNVITHNDISDFYYTGISVGWSWGYRDTICHRNKIAFNHIHHLGWGVLSDMGGIYTLGVQEGGVLRNNVIHDVYSWNKFGYAGLGLYNDEGSTHITLENNLVYNTRDMTYHLHYGCENVVRNNILVNGENFQISCYRPEPHLSLTFERNIVYFRTGRLFWQTSVGERRWHFDYNVYWREGGAPLDFCGLRFPEWQALGQDLHSVIADPKFRNLAQGDFTLLPDSPALRLGFVPFDWRAAGLYGAADWRARAPRDYPPPQPAPEPPPPGPFLIDEDFEIYPMGTAPADAMLNIEGKGDAIVVTEEAAATGRKSLKFTDAAGLTHAFNPHLYYSPMYEAGVAHCSFDVRLEAGAELWHEYRDWTNNPYRVGPRLQFSGGKLIASGRELLSLPLGQWIHVDVRAPLGAAAQGQYTLTITLPGQTPQSFGLPYVDTSWNKLTWLGFSSVASGPSVFYIDNLRLENIQP